MVLASAQGKPNVNKNQSSRDEVTGHPSPLDWLAMPMVATATTTTQNGKVARSHQ